MNKYNTDFFIEKYNKFDIILFRKCVNLKNGAIMVFIWYVLFYQLNFWYFSYD